MGKEGDAMRNERIKRLFESKASPYLFRGFDLQSGRAGNNAGLGIRRVRGKTNPMLSILVIFPLACLREMVGGRETGMVGFIEQRRHSCHAR